MWVYDLSQAEINQTLGHINLIYAINYPWACQQVNSPPLVGPMGLQRAWWKPVSTSAMGLLEESSLLFHPYPQGESQSLPRSWPQTTPFLDEAMCVCTHNIGNGHSLTNLLDPRAEHLKCIVRLACSAWGWPSAAQSGIWSWARLPHTPASATVSEPATLSL